MIIAQIRRRTAAKPDVSTFGHSKNKPNSGIPEFGVSRRLKQILRPRSIRSVYAGVRVMAQPFDLVFHMQFASFEFHYSQVIDRGMVQAFGDFVFKYLMPSFQFRKVRLHRHAVCLLNQWLSRI
jgi:hypothetical protein